MADRTSAAFDLVQRLKKQQRHQTAVGAAAVLFLLVFAGLLVYYKNTFLVHLVASSTSDTSQRPASTATPSGQGHSETGPPRYSLPPEDAISFPTMGIYLMLMHFGLIMASLLLLSAVFRAERLVHLLCWPMIALGPAIGDEHPGLFWPFMLANSALWGFAVAAIIYLLKRCWMHVK